MKTMRGGSVTFRGTALPRTELLRSPVSGTPCVHWRVRVVEQVDARLQLVHEISSPEAFDLAWPCGDGGVRIRVTPEALRLQAMPVLHRADSPGAAAAARHFGLSGVLTVEEVTLTAGQELTAQGWIDGGMEDRVGGGLDPARRALDDAGATESDDGPLPLSTDDIKPQARLAAASSPSPAMFATSPHAPSAWLAPSAPFRGVTRELELFEPTLSLPTRAAIGPALLPWALGTAAALLAGVGLASWAAWHFQLLPAASPTDSGLLPQKIGPHRAPVRQLP